MSNADEKPDAEKSFVSTVAEIRPGIRRDDLAVEPSTTDSGGGTYGGMDLAHSLNDRLHRLEGGNSVLKWSAGILTAVFIGLAAILVTLQIFMFGQLDRVEAKVDALPGEISRDIQELNLTLSQSITAARSVETPAPVVIQLPDSFVGTSAGGDEVTRPDDPGTENQTLEFQQQRN